MRAASLTFNSATFELHSSIASTATGCYIEEYDGLDYPSLRHVGQDRIGSDGYNPINNLWGARLISLTGHILADDLATYNQRRRDFAAFFANLRDSSGNPNRMTLKFTTDDQLDLQADVVLAKEPKAPPQNLIGGQYFLNLIAEDPQLLSQTLSTSSPITPPTGGGADLEFTLPVDLGASDGGTVIVTPGGSLYTWPIITLSGALTSPFLYNATTDKVWQLNTSLGASDELVISMHPSLQTAILNETSSLFELVDRLSIWWWLEPGANVINFSSGSSSDTGTMTLSYRAAYLGE